MPDTINWIHLTDLHFGLDADGWLWPGMKHILFRDLEKMSREVDGWDLVFFTGDFVQQGTAAQFENLNRELESLWKHLSKLGRTPYLCAVPGNHDLVRPPADSAVAHTMSKLWASEDGLRRKFWKDPKSELRLAVDDFFENYSTWISKLPVPHLPFKSGNLPGDFSACYSKGKTKLGIIGLNSTFLQIVPGNAQGKLDLHVSQLNAVCEGDPDTWIAQHSASILLTHQPESWLTEEGIEHFRHEIYRPGRFLAHLCGHLHDPTTHEISQAGSQARRTRQGPSLFGLEEWNGPVPTKRIHGYNAGQYVFENNNAFEKLWPRIAVSARSGGMHIAADTSYELITGDCIITPFEFNQLEKSEKATEVGQPDKDSRPEESASPLLEGNLTQDIAKRDLAFCPRFPLTNSPHHKDVRQDVQAECEHELRRSRLIWIAADWGAGSAGFLASVINRFRNDDKKPETFHLRCDDGTTIDELERFFPQQFGKPLQAFCNIAAVVPNSFLILDDIHPTLAARKNFDDIQRIAGAIIDYCPEMKLIIVSRMMPPSGSIPAISLKPLDAPDVRAYILQHPDSSPEAQDPDAIDKLYEHSGGSPMHLDRMLKALKVASLSSVLQAEMEGPSLNTLDETPSSLIHTVSKLSNSDEKRTKRSFLLLKVLSVLPYGETLEWLHHYISAEPFFVDNALQLKELALLDVVPLQATDLQSKGIAASGSDGSYPKLLKVPRQVRDYVQTLLSEEERHDIVLAGIERFCGREWRSGKFKLRSLPLEYREYLASGAGNEFALIHHLIFYAKNTGDTELLLKGATLGIQYVQHLRNAERYRDLASVAGPLLQLLDSDQIPAEWARMSVHLGEGLRMTGRHDEALRHSKAALTVGDKHLTKTEKSRVLVTVALAEKALGHPEEAKKAAAETHSYAKSDSSAYHHASAIIADLSLKDGLRTKKLAEIEKQARAAGHTSVANTIAIDFAHASETPNSKIKHLDRVLESTSNSYNHARAIIAKSRAINQGASSKLKSTDIIGLSWAYSYLHTQRFGNLFDQCHEQLWTFFESNNNISQLYKLFRHSSFIWRIRGEEAKEANYLKRLETKKNASKESGSAGLLVELKYFFRRLQIVLIGPK